MVLSSGKKTSSFNLGFIPHFLTALWACTDTPNVYDSYGDSCDWYNSYTDSCGDYDDFDFVSTSACCACGGGTQNDDGKKQFFSYCTAFSVLKNIFFSIKAAKNKE